MKMKHVTLSDFLTKSQIDAAFEIYKADDQPAARIAKEIIEPNLTEINRKLGQENDAKFLAYACEHVFNQVGRG